MNLIKCQDKKDSNNILSIRNSEVLMFLSQFFQLVIDFHFGFYVVHMQQRVPYAFEVYVNIPPNCFDPCARCVPVLLCAWHANNELVLPY